MLLILVFYEEKRDLEIELLIFFSLVIGKVVITLVSAVRRCKKKKETKKINKKVLGKTCVESFFLTARRICYVFFIILVFFAI